jgi:hypothetical protein
MSDVRETIVIRHESLVDKVCPVCGREFRAVNRKRYCSATCLSRAAYLRQADKRRADRREAYRRKKQLPQQP